MKANAALGVGVRSLSGGTPDGSWQGAGTRWERLWASQREGQQPLRSPCLPWQAWGSRERP